MGTFHPVFSHLIKNSLSCTWSPRRINTPGMILLSSIVSLAPSPVDLSMSGPLSSTLGMRAGMSFGKAIANSDTISSRFDLGLRTLGLHSMT